MATVTKGRTFVSGETVTPAKLNELVDNATVTGIQTADIADGAVTSGKIADGTIVNTDVSDSAAIALSKLATGALPTGITVATANIVDGTIVDADINASAAIAGSKLADGGIAAAKLSGAQTGSAPIFGPRAWVNFDGTSVTNVGGEDRCTIRASGNVAKVVRNSTGDYTVHLTTAMVDANFSVSISASSNYGVRPSGALPLHSTSAWAEEAPTASTFRFATADDQASVFNPKHVSVVVIR